MSNETQHNSVTRQARPTSKVRNIVIGALAGLACLVPLVGCGDSLEDKAKPIVEKAYKKIDLNYAYECQKIANLEEIGPGRYRGTAVMKAVDLPDFMINLMDKIREAAKSPTQQKHEYEGRIRVLKENEERRAKLQRGEGPVKSRTVYIEDLGDYMTVEFER